MHRNDQQFIAQKIRAQYMEKESSELDGIRALDAKVKRPANVFAYTFGGIGAIVMGTGMSLVMTELAQMLGLGGEPMVYGTAIGIVGLLMAAINYPIYRAILGARKKKYASQILSVSDSIINKQ